MGYPLLQKNRGKKGLGYDMIALCPAHYLISLLLCTYFSPLAICLSVYKKKAEITNNPPFPLSLFTVFIHVPSLRHPPYCTDHHTVFFSQGGIIRVQHALLNCNLYLTCQRTTEFAVDGVLGRPGWVQVNPQKGQDTTRRDLPELFAMQHFQEKQFSALH